MVLPLRGGQLPVTDRAIDHTVADVAAAELRGFKSTIAAAFAAALHIHIMNVNSVPDNVRALLSRSAMLGAFSVSRRKLRACAYKRAQQTLQYTSRGNSRTSPATETNSQ